MNSASQASVQIRRLACGFARGVRAGRHLLPLTAYIDDSGSSANGPVYVLAGFASTYDRWAEFSDAWQGALKEYGLAYFKAREAFRLDGQFANGWTPALRDKVAFELAELVQGVATVRVSVTVFRKDYDEFFGNMEPALAHYTDPYHSMFWLICRLVIEYQFRKGMTDPCDFVFDTQGEIGVRALAWWPQWPKWINAERKHLLGDPPIFRDDKVTMPLQAADLYAFLVRGRLHRDAIERWQAKACMKALQSVPLQNFHMTRERLIGIRAALSVERAAFFGWT